MNLMQLLEEVEAFASDMEARIWQKRDDLHVEYSGYQDSDREAIVYRRIQQELDTIERAAGNLARRLMVEIEVEELHDDNLR